MNLNLTLTLAFAFAFVRWTQNIEHPVTGIFAFFALHSIRGAIELSSTSDSLSCFSVVVTRQRSFCTEAQELCKKIVS